MLIARLKEYGKGNRKPTNNLIFTIVLRSHCSKKQESKTKKAKQNL